MTLEEHRTMIVSSFPHLSHTAGYKKCIEFIDKAGNPDDEMPEGWQVKLSPFNLNTYLIRLCSNFGGVWMPIKNGHHFDVESWAVNPLISVNRRLLPRFFRGRVCLI